MKSIASMPAIAGQTFRPLRTKIPSSALLKRSQSMATSHKPQERLKHMARRVPFMAFPGVSSRLSNFARSFSRANLARLGGTLGSSGSAGGLGSRSTSSVNVSYQQGGYGSLGASQSQVGTDVLTLSSPPALMHDRDYSEGGIFGTLFNEDDLEMMQPGWTLSLGLAVFTAVLASFQVGYNSGVLNVPQTTIVASLHLTTLQWSIAVSIFCIGGLIGSMTGGRAADRIGRKNFLIANNVTFIIGGLLQALSTSIFMLSFGRFLIGIGCGSATVVVPMYLGEIAPANLRGSLGTMNQFSMVVGILVANLLGKPLGTEQTWRYLLGACLLPALLQIILAATLLESPLWLIQQGGAKNRSHAEEILSKLRDTDEVEFDIECMIAEVEGGHDDDDDADMEWKGGSNHGSSNDLFGDGENSLSASSSYSYGNTKPMNIQQLDEQTSLLSSNTGKTQQHFSHNPTLTSSKPLERGSLAPQVRAHQAALEAQRSSLLNPDYRRPLLIGFGLQLVQQFSGINAVFFYSTMFFTAAHMSDPWLGSVLASGVNVLATGASIYLIERTGRRPLLLMSTLGMMLSCIGLTYALERNLASAGMSSPPAWIGPASILLVLIFVSFFEIGLGPIPWLIGSEIYPRIIRTQAMGISSTINWLSNFAVGLSFPTLAEVLGPYSFAPFGCILFVALILEYFYVPETQGKSLEEIQEEFVQDVNAVDEDDASSVGGPSATPTTITVEKYRSSSGVDVPANSVNSINSSNASNGNGTNGGHHPQATPIPEGEEDLMQYPSVADGYEEDEAEEQEDQVEQDSGDEPAINSTISKGRTLYEYDISTSGTRKEDEEDPQ